ncbi:MAG: PASTA domain-containing protein [Pseudomonadota bacterium]|nr:PASTA domain-containing protein [Pseudomonadota bacterium]
MRAKSLLQSCVTLLLAGTVTAATAQLRIPCSEVLATERDFVRAWGGCRDVAPIVDVAPKTTEVAPAVVVPVPSVVGLGFDDARSRLAAFRLLRSYRASGEPGGTVLEQQPAPPARLAAGANVRVVLSDGSLRASPRVAESNVDGAPVPPPSVPVQRSQPAVVADQPRTASPVESRPVEDVVQRGPTPPAPAPFERASGAGERVAVPNVLGMTIRNAQARLDGFRVERSERSSQAPSGRVIEQTPTAPTRVAAGQIVALVVSSGPARSTEVLRTGAVVAPVIETLELPNLAGRSFADASRALAEFKVTRIETASAAPGGQVVAQEPVAGTWVQPGSTISLQVSDGSLASAAVTTPAVVLPAPAPVSEAAALPAPAPVSEAAALPAPAPVSEPAALPAPAPVQSDSDRSVVEFPDAATLAIVAGVLVLLLGVLIAARWLRRRPVNPEPAMDIEPVAQPDLSPPANLIAAAVVVPAPEIKFAARLDDGETTVEFVTQPEADEPTLERSRELHE